MNKQNYTKDTAKVRERLRKLGSMSFEDFDKRYPLLVPKNLLDMFREMYITAFVHGGMFFIREIIPDEVLANIPTDVFTLPDDVRETLEQEFGKL